MKYRVAQIIQRFGIMLMLLMLVTSLIMPATLTHAESKQERAGQTPSLSNLWPGDDLASAVPPQPDAALRAQVNGPKPASHSLTLDLGGLVVALY